MIDPGCADIVGHAFEAFGDAGMTLAPDSIRSIKNALMFL